MKLKIDRIVFKENEIDIKYYTIYDSESSFDNFENNLIIQRKNKYTQIIIDTEFAMKFDKNVYNYLNSYNMCKKFVHEFEIPFNIDEKWSTMSNKKFKLFCRNAINNVIKKIIFEDQLQEILN